MLFLFLSLFTDNVPIKNYNFVDAGWIFDPVTLFEDLTEPFRINFKVPYGVLMFNNMVNVSTAYTIGKSSDTIFVDDPFIDRAFTFGNNLGSFSFYPEKNSTIQMKITAMPPTCSYLKITNSNSSEWIGTPPVLKAGKFLRKCAALMASPNSDDWVLDLQIQPELGGTLDLTSNTFTKNGPITIWYGSTIVKFTGTPVLKSFNLRFETNSANPEIPNNFFSQMNSETKHGFLKNEKWSTSDHGKAISAGAIVGMVFASVVFVSLIGLAIYCAIKKRTERLVELNKYNYADYFDKPVSNETEQPSEFPTKDDSKKTPPTGIRIDPTNHKEAVFAIVPPLLSSENL